MKICFLARPSFDRYSVAIFKNLRERYDSTIEGFFITSNQSESDYVKNNINNVSIHETSKYIRDNWEVFNKEKLIEFESKYDCAPIW